LNWTRHIKE